jgi:hypothetical protein
MLALLIAFLIILSGVIWANQRGYIIFQPPQFKLIWLLLIALLPRLSLFYFNHLGPLQLISTQVLVLLFSIANHRIPGAKVLLLGLLANMIATISNGVLMPVSADLMPYLYTGEWQVYDRIGWSVILPPNEITFYWLSDSILIKTVGKTYSPGDVLAFIGAVWVLAGCIKPVHKGINNVSFQKEKPD